MSQRIHQIMSKSFIIITVSWHIYVIYKRLRFLQRRGGTAYGLFAILKWTLANFAQLMLKAFEEVSIGMTMVFQSILCTEGI